MAAAEAFFATYELTENIIAQLPRRQIPRMQVVCRQWRKLVGESFLIRKARCLGVAFWPEDGNELEFDEWHDITRLGTNDEQRIWYDEDQDDAEESWYRQAKMLMPAVINSLLIQDSTHGFNNGPNRHFTFDITNLLKMDLDKMGAQCTCNPPMRIVYLEAQGTWNDNNRYMKSSAYCSFRNPTGITIKDLAKQSKLLISTADHQFSWKVFLTSYILVTHLDGEYD